MTTVTIGVSTLEDAEQRLADAFNRKASGARISFASEELLWKVLTAKRWALLRTMTGQGTLGIREIARRLGRDARAVHSDVHMLLKAGILNRAEGRGVVFPYDAIHVDFVLKAA